MASRDEIESFLNQLKTKLNVFGVAFRGRDKNLTGLIEFDITPIQREEHLKKLTVENYCSGPNRDKDIPGMPDYYEFGSMINGKESYIKLSLGLKDKMVDCISFHVAERPLNYPLKTQPNEDKS